MEINLEKRVASVEDRIQAAAAKSGRTRASITLVAVSKKFSAGHLISAYHSGLRIFGENYVQEFAEKKPDLAVLKHTRFHLIGHLQSNKARLACELFDTIQTVDSSKLLKRIDTAAGELGKQVEAFLEIKLSQEEAKAGAGVDDIPGILDAAAACRNVTVSGLMTMPPWSEDPESSRPYFRRLAEIGAQFGLTHLSMGMSNDLEVAIEEGATLVRVGTAIFGPRPKPAAE